MQHDQFLEYVKVPIKFLKTQFDAKFKPRNDRVCGIKKTPFKSREKKSSLLLEKSC